MNITYDIIETENNLINNNNTYNSSVTTENILYSDDEILALVTNYNLNYNLGYLNSIMDFYNIKKHKNTKKNDIINSIVKFETNSDNKEIVKERIRLFSNFIELKNNDFFNKFIIGSL